ncbi:MAG: amidohydrolase family protein, partial [Bacteroidales bacterium]|nr:amidohydrolase family protein [Bacteroidales bacterium]
MERLLIENVILEGKRVDILSENGTIVRIAPKVEVTGECNRLDGKGMTVLPGFINMHTHAAMTLMRGIKEDVPLYDWLTYIWSVEERLDDDLIYWGAKLACLEMIKSGTTTFMDMYWRIPWACKATEEMGLRSVQSIVMLDHFDKKKSIADREECQQMYELSKNWNQNLTSFAVSIHADYTNSKENILWSAEFARKHGLKIHLHVAETEKEVKDAYQNYGMSPVAYHDSLGVWGSDVVAAHAVWLS